MNNHTPHSLAKTKKEQIHCCTKNSYNSNRRWQYPIATLLFVLLISITQNSYGAGGGTLGTATMPAAATLCPSAVNQPVYSFSVQGTGGGVAISNLQSVTITGFSPGDVTNFKVYWSSSNTFTTTNAVVCSKSSPTTGSITFTTGTAAPAANGIKYYWITADIASSPTNGSTITVAAMTSTNVVGATAGSSTAGNTLTIRTAPASITGTATVCVNATTTLANSVTGGTWSSQNTSIAIINSSGVVTGQSAGNATIDYSTGCGTTATVIVTVNANPTASSVTGGGSYCSGGSGVAVGLGGSQSGVNYQLYNGSSTTGSPVAGTGSSISFGSQTAAGTYTVRATNATTSCTTGMTGSAAVTINLLPNAYSVTGGGNYCSGGSGVAVGLGGSESGVNYQLYNGSSTSGSPVAGTGSSIAFGAQTSAGTYTVRATNPSTTCVSGMTGSAAVSINPLPTTFTVSGGGSYCSGGSGLGVDLGGSQSGVNYQLYNGSSTTGSPVAGTGSSISFGSQTAAGTYTVRATNASTSCVAGMTGSAAVVVNALPTTFSVTGGGNYCTGGSGVAVGLGGSQSGVNYQLYNGSSTTGSPVSGTGSSISFGAQTATGTYTVFATNSTTSCTSNMTGSASVSINPLPGTFTVTGGGNYCSGDAGVVLGLDGSASGINYQLYNGSSTAGSPVAGTGSAISFGAQTAAGTYTVRATNATTSCISGMTGSASVTVDPLPTASTVTGGGNYCSGGSGVSVGLNGSQSGVNYQLYNGSSTVGSPVSGTGSALDFGSQTAAGTYTVRATNATTSCVSGMTGSASVTVDPLPTASTVTGGGNYCSGGSGVSVGLDGSQSGVNYQLYNGSSTSGSPVSGTGSAISFGAQTAAGNYTVRATNATTSCVSGMTGSASVTVDPLPTAATVTGGGNYCSGGSGVSVGLDGSQSGVNYQLYNGSSTAGSPISGTGSAISFGAQTAAGTYTVRATNATTSCVSGMTGSASVAVDPLPTAATVTGGGNYCSGGSGVSVGLDGSQSGVNYQLYNGSSTVGSPVSGTGSALSFGAQTAAGSYTVRATNATTSCVSGMTGSASVTVDPLPTAATVTGGGNYCSGGSGVSVGLDGSQSGVNYQLYNGSSTSGSPVSGTGSAISFGAQTAAGSYTVRATNATTSCVSGMTGSASVTVDPLPNAATVTGGGNYCSGGSGVSVGLDGSQSGVNYQLYNGSSTSGSPVSGTGSAISFGAQTAAGTYTVQATNATTSCISGMTGSASVTVDPLPTAATVTGGGNYCSGGSGVNVGLDGSQSGVNYQLYNGSSTSGSPVSGTGGTISFGAQTAAGTYTVRATNATTSCVSGMTGSASVTVDPLPTAATVTGGGNYCSGGSGVSVGLDGSQSGVNYQLYNGSSTSGSPVSGTGSALSFGAQTAAGSYTVRATNATTSCVSGMTGSASVTVDPLPTAATVTGGGNYCSGGSGVSVGLDGSQSGVNYQLYNGSSTAGSPVSGTGSALSFGAQTAAGSYTVRATNATTSCVSGMTGSASVTIDPLPTPFTVTGGGSYCSGGSGIIVGLNGSESGVDYQLYNGASTVGSPVAGTGSGITFGAQTAAGTYTILATNATTGCTAAMPGSAVISVDALPTTFTVSGGGNYCSGGSGVSVGLGGSQSGVDYQLYNGSSTAGSPVSGTGSAISFGAQTAAGTYTVRATNATTGCVSGMTGSASVTVDPLPTAQTVTGGGNYCSGGSGVSVGLYGSQSGINYQLYNGSSTSGSPVSGTGSAISFGAQTTAGTYTVRATNATTSCVSGMTGSASVTVDPLPTAATVTGGGNYCSSGSGVSVGLDGSQSGVNYQLYNGSSTSGSPVSGTGSAISFGAQTAAGTYTVRATNATTSCVSGMTGSASVTIDPLPAAATVTGGGNYCSGGAGVSVGLDGSESGVNYQLYNGSSTVGSPVSGTNSAISFGAQTAAGTYTIRATNATTSCVSGMTGSASVSIDPLPSAFTVTGGGTYCPGGSLVDIGLSGSQSGVDYQLYSGSTTVGSAVSGTGSAIAFASQSDAGTYTVVATNASTSCARNMTGSAVVTAGSLPSAGTITGASTVCISNQVTLSNATSGGDWSSDNTTVASISATGVVTGNTTGSATISYTVTNTCGSASATHVVTVNAIPDAGTITGTATVCDGSTTTLSNLATGGDWSSTNTSVATVTNAGVVTGIASGTSTISYTVLGTCGTTAATRVVTVLANPTAGTITGASAVCDGASVTLGNAITGGAWSSSNSTVASVSSSGVVSGNSAGVVDISYTVTNSCGSDVATHSVTVNAITGNAGSISGTAFICLGDNTTLSTTGFGGNWSSSNTSVATVDASGVVTGANAGTSTISYTVTGCGAGVATRVVSVNSTPSAGTIMGASSVALGLSITLTDAVSGGTWSGTNANASVSSTGVVSGIALGTVVVSYTVTSSCGTGTTTKIVNVVSGISGNSGTLSMCVGETTTLSNSTSGGTWSSNNTSVATVNITTGVVSGIASGMATISYVTSAGTATSVVTVNSTPTAITGALAICVGKTTSLNNAAVGYGIWTSSNTSVATIGSATGYVTGVSGGTAAITYTLSTGCSGSAIVTVNTNPAAISGAANICIGTSVTLSSSTPGGAWSSGNVSDATINSSGVATGVGNGIADITYTLTTGCKTSTTITVSPLPAAITGSTVMCAGAATNLSSTTAGGTWSSSNLSVATVGTSGTVNGIVAGTSTISYTTGASCARSVEVTVNPVPSISGSAAVCPGGTATLSPTPSGGSWSGGNASIATINSSGVVTGIGAGTANVTYSLASGCKAFATASVNAAPATITGTTKACIGATTTLSNTSGGGTWSSSDGSVATIGLANGVVSGIAAGTVTITYTTGVSCYRTTTVTINSSPAAITGNVSPVCVGSSFTLSDVTPGLSWSGSNSSVATIASTGVVTGIGAGTSTITYTAASTSCIATTEVSINAAPSAIGGPSTGCTGSTITLTNASSGGVWASGNTAIATINASTGVLTGVAAGTVTITYSTGAGCTQTKAITIGTAPTLSGYPTVCIGLNTTLSGGYGTWSSGNPSVATIVTSGGYVTGVSAGTAAMTFTNSASCPATYVVTVIPVPAAITGTTTACTGDMVTLSNTTPGGSWSSNNTAGATVGSATGIVTAVGTGGSVTISYAFGNNCRVTTPFNLKPLPAVFGGSPSVCMPMTTTLTNTTPGGTWTSSNTAVATVGTAISASYGVLTGLTAGTSNVTYTITNTGCARSTVVTVTAGLDPGTLTSSTGAFTLRTVSSPTSLTLSSSGAPGGTWSSSNPLKATVNTSGVVTAVSSGTTTITYTVTGACTNYVTRLITISSGKPAGTSPSVADLALYPNPTPGTFTLTTSEAGIMTIFAIDGRAIYSFDVTSGSALYSLEKGMAAGVYMCRFIGNDGGTANIRLVYEP